MTTTATATDTTVARYTVITDGGSAMSYRDRDFAQIVARRDRNGVLSDIQVVVTWAGREGRATIDGEHTIDDLSENYDDALDGVLAAIEAADVAALAEIIREATDAHSEAVDSCMEVTDFDAVAAAVASALGEEPGAGFPVTRREAIEWRSQFVDEDFVEIAAA